VDKLNTSEYDRGEIHPNGIESMCKQAHKWVYHKVSLNQLPKYVEELAWWQNVLPSRYDGDYGETGSRTGRKAINLSGFDRR